MSQWFERLLWYGAGPLLAVLLFEHLVLKYAYARPSSLQRLTSRLSATGIADIVMWATVWVPYGPFFTLVRFVTAPGLALLFLIWANRKLEWNGLFGGPLFDQYILNFLIWYLVFDFSHYLAHYLLHRVPLFWRFHKLHHSATEMNIITGTRVSFAERAFNQLVSFGLLTIICGIPTTKTAFLLLMVRQFVEMVQHSDLPWDYGPIGYIVAGPRFHKMHHSCDERDYNANYGNLFTFWDRIFGTISSRYRQDGSQVVDTIKLGLGDETEDRNYSRWYVALFHETVFHYVLIAGKAIIKLPRR